MKSEFLATLNHEIRSPLSSILGLADLLLETRLDEQQKMYVSAARTCGEELLEQLNAALEFSALAAGHLEIEEADFDLRGVLQGVLAQHRPRAEAKGLRLIDSGLENLPSLVAGDAVRLRQTVSQLLGNAVKFTARGEIELTAAASPAVDGHFRLSVTVRDTGIGIAAGQIKAIFEPFVRAERGLTRSYAGLGLGLAVVEQLVAFMGGEVEVQSQPGQGATFSFWVPLRISAEFTGTPAEPRPASIPKKPIRAEELPNAVRKRNAGS